MKDIVFIIPYFGKFRNYFQLYLDSCAANREYDFLFLTDDKRAFDYPDNVTVIYTTFEAIRERFQSKFEFSINLQYPYKLCDFKPAYGYVFEDLIKDYRGWGYCDTDMIWGDISHFISKEDIETFDKIGILGHCTVFKNTKEVNRLFMKEVPSGVSYKEIYTAHENCSFDEEFIGSINTIFEYYKRKIRYQEYEANIYTKSSNLRITRMKEDKRTYSVEKKKNAFFVWDRGTLRRYEKKENKVVATEYLYIHLQSRPMKNRVSDLKNCPIKIIPNSFDPLEIYEITENTFDYICKKHFNLHYFILRSKNLWKKIKRRVR